jgi:hypothetical protein
MPDVLLDLGVFKAWVKHERVSKVAPSLGKTGSFDFCLWRRTDSNAATASALRCTVRAHSFLVFVRSMVRRSRLTSPQVREYCSERRIPVFTDTTNSARCVGKRSQMTSQRRSYSLRVRYRSRPPLSRLLRTCRAGFDLTFPLWIPSRKQREMKALYLFEVAGLLQCPCSQRSSS